VEEVETVLQAVLENRIGQPPRNGKFALIGHSFGALTNCVVAGLPAEGTKPSRSYPIDALVALSPYGNSFPTQRLGIDPSGFRSLPQPTLFVSGTRDELFTLGRGCKAHLEPFLLSPSPEKKHVMVGGTRHGNFSEVFGWVRPQTKVMVNSTTTAFLDAHLLGLEHPRNYLDGELSLVAFEHESWVF
jgi:hypothetical protein